jgi:hypothetical protein
VPVRPSEAYTEEPGSMSFIGRTNAAYDTLALGGKHSAVV